MTETTSTGPLGTAPPPAGDDAAGRRPERQGRARPTDTLLHCLLRLARDDGRSVDEAELRALSPIPETGMTVGAFAQAARRLGYAVQRIPYDLGAAGALPTPFVLLGAPEVGALLATRRDDGMLALFRPVDGSVRALPLADTVSMAREALALTQADPIRPARGWRSLIADRLKRVAAELTLEARDKRRAVDENWRSEVLDRLSSVRRDTEKAYSQLLQDRTRLRNRVVRAPAEGVVQQLAIAAAGQSVAPNETMMQIVPGGDGLVIEARVANDDIGYIHPGQRATIKVKTYDYVRYGTLSGVVERVAADAVEDKRTGALSFPVMVRADRPWLGDGKGRLALAPGMQVDVDLQIGKRSVLSYLTERLSRARQSAFTER